MWTSAGNAGRLIVVAAVLAAVTAPPRAGAQAAAETTYDNPSMGLSIRVPTGWHASAGAFGAIVVSPEPGNVNRPAVFFRHGMSTVPVTPAAFLQTTASFMALTLCDWKPLGIRQSGPGLGMSGQYRVGRTRLRTVMAAHVVGSYIQFTGLQAPAATFQREAPALVKVLATVQFRVPKMAFVPFTEPREGSFQVLVPQGWRVVGRIDRPMFDANYFLEMRDPTNQVTVIYRQLYAYFAEPAGFLREGQMYTPQPGIIRPYEVRRYIPAAAYLRVRGSRVGRLISLRTRPDLCASPTHEQSMQIPGTRFDAAEGLFDLGRGNVRFRRISTYRSDPFRMGGGWSVSGCEYTAPQARIHEAEAALASIFSSFVMNPQWQVIDAKGRMQRLAILANANRAVFQIIHDVTVNKATAANKAARNFDAYIRTAGGIPFTNQLTGKSGETTMYGLQKMKQQFPGYIQQPGVPAGRGDQ